MNLDFYSKLNPVSKFRDVTRDTSYHPVPEDWWVVITDVVNSTTAITKGKYKEVNTAGAVAIVALANQGLYTYVPVIFGGDGITLLTPPEFLGSIKDIFHCTRNFVKDGFDLDLRVGLVSVSEIRQAGFTLMAGKFSENNPFQQAIFLGDGFDFAEKLIKSGDKKYLLSEDHTPHLKADYSGFTCPFRDVKSEQGNILSLIIKKGKNSTSYEKMMDNLLDLLGNEKDYYPVSFKNVNMGVTASELSAWTTVAAGKNKGIKYNLLGIFHTIMTRIYSLTIDTMRKEFAKTLPLFSDYRKFDSALKMVVSCTPQKSEELKNWLEKKESEGEIIFGVHESNSSLLTCLFNGKKGAGELHLIDGSNGGYALAAKALKEKLQVSHF